MVFECEKKVKENVCFFFFSYERVEFTAVEFDVSVTTKTTDVMIAPRMPSAAEIPMAAAA